MKATGRIVHVRNVRDGEMAQKLRVASFYGGSYGSERDAETGELHIYQGGEYAPGETGGAPAEKLLVASFPGSAFSSEKDAESGDLHIYHFSGGGGYVPVETMSAPGAIKDMRRVGDAPLAPTLRTPGSGHGKPDFPTTLAEFLAGMSAEERAEGVRRAVEQRKLSEQEAEQARSSSVAWNARQTAQQANTTDDVRLQKFIQNIAKSRDGKCGCASAKDTMRRTSDTGRGPMTPSRMQERIERFRQENYR